MMRREDERGGGGGKRWWRRAEGCRTRDHHLLMRGRQVVGRPDPTPYLRGFDSVYRLELSESATAAFSWPRFTAWSSDDTRAATLASSWGRGSSEAISEASREKLTAGRPGRSTAAPEATCSKGMGGVEHHPALFAILGVLTFQQAVVGSLRKGRTEFLAASLLEAFDSAF